MPWKTRRRDSVGGHKIALVEATAPDAAFRQPPTCLPLRSLTRSSRLPPLGPLDPFREVASESQRVAGLGSHLSSEHSAVRN